MSKGSRWTKFVGEKKGYTSYDADLLSHNHSIIYINHFINYYVQIALHKLHSPPLLFNFHLKVCVCVYSTVYSTQTDSKNHLKLNEYLLTGWSDIIRLSLHPHQRVFIAISIFDNFFWQCRLQSSLWFSEPAAGQRTGWPVPPGQGFPIKSNLLKNTLVLHCQTKF